MEALVLERKGELSLRDIDLPLEVGPHEVKIAINTVGICASDVHYYEHGAIGPFVVREPMVLGHEAAGTVVEVGAQVKHLKPGDRVCMEPGIPDPNSRASRLGIYNLDPAVRFWATPPVHGCLTPYVVHPAAYTFKLPPNVSFAEGAMVEPLAVGMHAAWDYGQSFLYGVGDSGIFVSPRLLETHPTGSPLLSGGTTGPEGSVFSLLVLAAIAVLIQITRYGPEQTYATRMPQTPVKPPLVPTETASPTNQAG